MHLSGLQDLQKPVDYNRVSGLIIDAAGQPRTRLQHSILGWLQDAVEAAQHDEREYHLAVFRLFEVAAQDFSNGPEEGRSRLNVGSIRYGHLRSIRDSGGPFDLAEAAADGYPLKERPRDITNK
jgi:hypothetical protein